MTGAQELRERLVNLVMKEKDCWADDAIECAAKLERYIARGATPTPEQLAERIAEDSTLLGKSLRKKPREELGERQKGEVAA